MIRQSRTITAAQENLANKQSALRRAGAQIMAPKPESHYDKFGCALEAASACFSGLANVSYADAAMPMCSTQYKTTYNNVSRKQQQLPLKWGAGPPRRQQS